MTTETEPARFALDETRAAGWLAAYMTDQEIGPEWSPSGDYDGDTIGGMTYEASGQGIITAPDGMTVEYEYTTDGDGGGFRWLLYTGQNYRSLRIASPYQRAWRIGEYDAYGAEAAVLVLANAVEWANNLLDDLAAYVAERAAA